jgi:hypothetical protein
LKILAIKKIQSLIPFGDYDRDEFAKIGNGEVIGIEIKRPRNIAFHNKFFAMIGFVYKHQDLCSTFKLFRKHVEILAGYYTIEKFNGEEIKEAKSISFAAMSQDEFDQFYSDCLNVCAHILGDEDIDLLGELERFR